MKVRYLVAAVAVLSVAASAFAADDAEALFKQNRCSSCHKLDKKMVGPTLKELSVKYAGEADAQARLAAKARSGGAGAWGTLPMPGTPSSVSDETIKTIVAWMLSHK